MATVPKETAETATATAIRGTDTWYTVSEQSLRWVLDLRKDAATHRYDIDTILRDFPALAAPHWGHSFRWTVAQARHIDAIGLTAWLRTRQAAGYAANLYLGEWMRGATPCPLMSPTEAAEVVEAAARAAEEASAVRARPPHCNKDNTTNATNTNLK